jgi:hypothetical protein
MNGEQSFDLIFMHSQYMIGAYLNGMVWTFDQFLPANADVLGEQRFIADFGKVFGKNFVMNRVNYAMTKGHYATLLGVNLDIIAEVGCADPRDYYDKDEWTWDKFEEICKAVKNASTEKRTFIPMAGIHANIVSSLIASNGGGFYNDITGEVLIDSQRTMEALNFYARLLTTEKYIYVFINRAGDFELWGDGNQYIFQKGNTAIFNLVTWQVTSGSWSPTWDMGITSYPWGPGYKGVSWFKDMRGFAIPKTSPDPKSVYKIYEEFNSWYGDDPDIHETNWRDGTAKFFQSAKDYERLTKIGRTEYGYDLIDSYYGGTFTNGFIEDVFAKGMSAMSSMESQRSELESRINELINWSLED